MKSFSFSNGAGQSVKSKLNCCFLMTSVVLVVMMSFFVRSEESSPLIHLSLIDFLLSIRCVVLICTRLALD